MKRLLMLIVAVGLIVGAAFLGRAFPAANATPIDLDLLWIRLPNVEAWLLVLACLGLGAFLGAMFVSFFWMRGWVVNRRYRKVIKRLESELHQLRSLPLAGEIDVPLIDSKKQKSTKQPKLPTAAAAGQG